MGLGSWLRKAIGGSTEPPAAAPDQRAPDQPSVALTVSFESNPCLEVAGTTTFANHVVAALADRKGLGEQGYFEGQAQLQRDPENPVDGQAVAVLVDGEKVAKKTQTAIYSADYSQRIYGEGGLLPRFADHNRGSGLSSPMYVYRWERMEELLVRNKDIDGDPYEALMVEYVDPTS